MSLKEGNKFNNSPPWRGAACGGVGAFLSFSSKLIEGVFPLSPLSKRRIPYDPKLVSKVRELRKQGILSEVFLWNQLQNRGLRGYKFFRQKPIGPFIVDFFCEEL